MDRAVKRIRPSNFELSQIQDNLANPLQQVLDRLSADEDSSGTSALLPVLEQRNPSSTALSVKIPALFVGGREDGAYKINQPTILFGTPSARNEQGGLDAQKDSELFSYGQIVAFGSKVNSDGFVLIPQTDGPAFRVAPNNTYTAFQINFDGSAGCTGPFNAASFTSASGFKSWLPPAHYWNLSYPGGLVPLVVPIVQSANGSASTTPWGITMPRSGSITGVSATHTGATNIVCAVYIYRNGTLVYSANVTNGQVSGAVAIAKGTVPFVAADALSARVLYSQNGINVCTQVAIEVEEVA